MAVPLGFAVLILVLLMAPVLQQAAVGAQRRVLRRAWRCLEPELLVDAPVAYKTAQVFVSPDGLRAVLVGITSGVAYGASASAVCPRRRCFPPGLGCRCGFYAFKRRHDAVALLHETLPCNGLRHKALLTVALEGDVLQYERGYRAQRQSVLAVGFSSLCHRCEQHGVPRRAELLAAAPSYRIPTPPRLDLSVRTDPFPGAMPVRPVCSQHVPTAQSSLALRPSDIAGLLGAEVQWLAEEESTPAVPG